MYFKCSRVKVISFPHVSSKYSKYIIAVAEALQRTISLKILVSDAVKQMWVDFFFFFPPPFHTVPILSGSRYYMMEVQVSIIIWWYSWWLLLIGFAVNMPYLCQQHFLGERTTVGSLGISYCIKYIKYILHQIHPSSIHLILDMTTKYECDCQCAVQIFTSINLSLFGSI